MNTKKIAIGLILIILILLVLIGATSNNNNKNTENNITINGVTFTTPNNNNNHTNNITNPTGVGYEDYENNISVYVTDDIDYSYNFTESYSPTFGYSQEYLITNNETGTSKYVVVCADNANDKDTIVKTLNVTA